MAPNWKGYGSYWRPRHEEMFIDQTSYATPFSKYLYDNTKQVQSSRYGTKKQVVSKRRRKPRKKTIAKRVRLLEKNQDVKSKYTKYIKNLLQFKQTFLPGGAATVYAQQKIIGWFPGVSHQQIETFLSSSTIEYPSGTVDLTAKNTVTKISTFDHYVFKNANLYTVHIKLVKCMASDHTSLGPLVTMKNTAVDRGYTISQATSSAVPSGLGFSGVPQNQTLVNTENHYQILSYIYNNPLGLWKSTCPVKTIILLPGDSFDIYMSHSYKYKPEVADTEAFTYLKNYDYGVAVEVIGELAHGDSPATNDIIGYSDWDIDVSVRHKIVATVDNGLGLDVVANESDIAIPGNVSAFVQAGANNEIQ